MHAHAPIRARLRPVREAAKRPRLCELIPQIRRPASAREDGTLNEEELAASVVTRLRGEVAGNRHGEGASPTDIARLAHAVGMREKSSSSTAPPSAQVWAGFWSEARQALLRALEKEMVVVRPQEHQEGASSSAAGQDDGENRIARATTPPETKIQPDDFARLFEHFCDDGSTTTTGKLFKALVARLAEDARSMSGDQIAKILCRAGAAAFRGDRGMEGSSETSRLRGLIESRFGEMRLDSICHSLVLFPEFPYQQLAQQHVLARFKGSSSISVARIAAALGRSEQKCGPPGNSSALREGRQRLLKSIVEHLTESGRVLSSGRGESSTTSTGAEVDPYLEPNSSSSAWPHRTLPVAAWGESKAGLQEVASILGGLAACRPPPGALLAEASARDAIEKVVADALLEAVAGHRSGDTQKPELAMKNFAILLRALRDLRWNAAFLCSLATPGRGLLNLVSDRFTSAVDACASVFVTAAAPFSDTTKSPQRERSSAPHVDAVEKYLLAVFECSGDRRDESPRSRSQERCKNEQDAVAAQCFLLRSASEFHSRVRPSPLLFAACEKVKADLLALVPALHSSPPSSEGGAAKPCATCSSIVPVSQFFVVGMANEVASCPPKVQQYLAALQTALNRLETPSGAFLKELSTVPDMGKTLLLACVEGMALWEEEILKDRASNIVVLQATRPVERASDSSMVPERQLQETYSAAAFLNPNKLWRSFHKKIKALMTKEPDSKSAACGAQRLSAEDRVRILEAFAHGRHQPTDAIWETLVGFGTLHEDENLESALHFSWSLATKFFAAAAKLDAGRHIVSLEFFRDRFVALLAGEVAQKQKCLAALSGLPPAVGRAETQQAEAPSSRRCSDKNRSASTPFTRPYQLPLREYPEVISRGLWAAAYFCDFNLLAGILRVHTVTEMQRAASTDGSKAKASCVPIAFSLSQQRKVLLACSAATNTGFAPDTFARVPLETLRVLTGAQFGQATCGETTVANRDKKSQSKTEFERLLRSTTLRVLGLRTPFRIEVSIGGLLSVDLLLPKERHLMTKV